MIEYHVVLPFIRNEDDFLVAEPPIERPSAAAAVSKGRELARTKAGVIAFTRRGDPATGEFQPAVELIRIGDLPGVVE